MSTDFAKPRSSKIQRIGTNDTNTRDKDICVTDLRAGFLLFFLVPLNPVSRS